MAATKVRISGDSDTGRERTRDWATFLDTTKLFAFTSSSLPKKYQSVLHTGQSISKQDNLHQQTSTTHLAEAARSVNFQQSLISKKLALPPHVVSVGPLLVSTQPQTLKPPNNLATLAMCGVGFICHIKGHGNHKIVSDARSVLCNMTHRGASES